jgi:hypothetical protein
MSRGSLVAARLVLGRFGLRLVAQQVRDCLLEFLRGGQPSIGAHTLELDAGQFCKPGAMLRRHRVGWSGRRTAGRHTQIIAKFAQVL